MQGQRAQSTGRMTTQGILNCTTLHASRHIDVRTYPTESPTYKRHSMHACHSTCNQRRLQANPQAACDAHIYHPHKNMHEHSKTRACACGRACMRYAHTHTNSCTLWHSKCMRAHLLKHARTACVPSMDTLQAHACGRACTGTH
jgi:hypothetical protein